MIFKYFLKGIAIKNRYHLSCYGSLFFFENTRNSLVWIIIKWENKSLLKMYIAA